MHTPLQIVERRLSASESGNSRKRKRGASVQGGEKEHRSVQGKENGDSIDLANPTQQPDILLTDAAPSAEELQSLQDTPSKKRVKRLSGSKNSSRPVAGRDNVQDSNADGKENEETLQDTIVIETPNSRTSGRQRKQTWKLADTFQEPEPTPVKKRLKTPSSIRRTKAKANSILPPVPKESGEEPLNQQDVIGVEASVTPKKKKSRTLRSKQLEQPAEPFSSPQAIASEALAAVIDPEGGERTISVGNVGQEESQHVPIDALHVVSATPKKRGRSLKDTANSSPGTLIYSATPSKRSRKANPLLETNGIVLSPSTPSKRGKAVQTTRAVAPISWQQYKETGIQQPERPDPAVALQALEETLMQPEAIAALPQLRNKILKYLTGQHALPLQGLQDEYAKVRSVVEQTVAAGEGNSILLIGPRGSGKTAMVDSILAEMQNSAEYRENFHTIRLNGFIHTDDKLALREIWRQLGREMDVDDAAVLERSNYADTLASLLAILSHPSEQQAQERVAGDNPADIDELHVAKSIVFVIDEFDLFTTHARQTLLYNLFDVAQSRKAPIAVLGLTTRVDVAESLEKRVKSRFSHRYVFLPRPKSFFAFQQIILSALRAGEQPELADGNASAAPAATTELSTQMNGPTTDDLETQTPAYESLHTAWSTYITSLFAPDSQLTNLLRMIYMTSRSVPLALTSLTLPIMTFTSSSTIPSAASLSSTPLLPSDSKLSLLPSLTEIELALLIAAARLEIILSVDTCNFNMAYDEYATLSDRLRTQTSAQGALAVGAKAGGGRTWSRAAALAAWERLEQLELVMPMATAGYGAGAAGLADVGRAGKLVRCDVSLEEIKWTGGLQMSAQMAKWCKEI